MPCHHFCALALAKRRGCEKAVNQKTKPDQGGFKFFGERVGSIFSQLTFLVRFFVKNKMNSLLL